MSFGVLSAFAAMVLVTAFIAGIFGMAGGMILMGGLLLIMPVASAMVLHGITQLTSNGARAWLWRSHIHWRLTTRYMLGLLIAAVIFVFLNYVPDRRVVYVVLGLIPFLPLVISAESVPRATRPGGAESCGFICTVLQLLSGVSGPTLDLFFVNTGIGRRAIVATKATCQVLTHLTKLLYFGALVGGADGELVSSTVITVAIAFAVIGTWASRHVLERMSDTGFRRYTQWLMMAIGAAYLLQGGWGFV